MKTLLCIAILVLLCSCTSGTKSEDASGSDSHVSYFKDRRTSICFADYTSLTSEGFSVHAIATVPCSPTVEQLLR